MGLAELGGRLLQIVRVAAGVAGGRPLAGPLYVQLSVSDPCDHRCVMCSYHPPAVPRAPLAQFGHLAPGVMGFDTFRGLVEDLRRIGTRHVDLVGRGEPLLNPRIGEMVGYAKRRGMRVTMTSNASHLTEALARGFVADGLDAFKHSLNAGHAHTYPKIHATETPESWARNRDNVRRLAELRERAGRRLPRITVSFSIGRPNLDELEAMLETARGAGADEAQFQHMIDCEGLTSLGLDAREHRRLVEELVPAAARRARQLGLRSNLQSFARTLPPQLLDSACAGAVPCYVGGYLSVILGNGQVLPCCQTTSPLGRVGNGERFGEVWRGERYAAFRRAARRLPEPGPELAGADCGHCYFRAHNRTIHAALHPWRRATTAGEEPLFTVRQILRMSRADRRA